MKIKKKVIWIVQIAIVITIIIMGGRHQLKVEWEQPRKRKTRRESEKINDN